MSAADRPSEVRRIGLFGGSFNPVHNAHLALACVALEHLALDELRWVPTGHAWHKPGQLAAAQHRIAMLRLALADEPRCVIDPIELKRSGPSYTLDTVRALQAARPGHSWFLLIGQDQYSKFDTWVGWQALLPRVTLAVAGRAGSEPEAPPAVAAALAALQRRARRLPLPAMTVASTDIRQRAARGEPIGDLVPPEVAGYIESHALYRPGSQRNAGEPQVALSPAGGGPGAAGPSGRSQHRRNDGN